MEWVKQGYQNNLACKSISACVYDTLFHVCHALKKKFIRSRNKLISDSDSISANQLRFPFLKIHMKKIVQSRLFVHIALIIGNRMKYIKKYFWAAN